MQKPPAKFPTSDQMPVQINIHMCPNRTLRGCSTTPNKRFRCDDYDTFGGICFAQTVGLCGNLQLDGRSSSGTASRTLSASWNAFSAAAVSTTTTTASADDDDDALSSVTASLESFEGSLLAELNATVLAVGVEYTFSLTAKNFLGGEDEATATVTRM